MSNPKRPTPDQLASIDSTALAQVTGGTVASEANSLASQVNDILGSIKSISGTAKSNGLQPQEMMLFMMLLQQQNRAQAPATVTIAGPGVSWWGGRWW